jgi:hypothetical protein
MENNNNSDDDKHNNNSNNDNNSNDNNNESAEDRLNYLRERGVEISTHEERAAAKEANANIVAPIFEQLAKLCVNDDDDGSDGSIKFVLIPHDESKPMKTVKLPSTFTNDHGTRSGDLITTFVKPYFADRRSVDANILQQTATKHFSSGTIQGSDGGGIDMSKISPSAMNAVAAEGSVEVS